MTRAEGLRLYGTPEDGPDPTEDPILYLEKADWEKVDDGGF